MCWCGVVPCSETQQKKVDRQTNEAWSIILYVGIGYSPFIYLFVYRPTYEYILFFMGYRCNLFNVIFAHFVAVFVSLKRKIFEV